MNKQFEFKVGDKVKIMFYSKEHNMFWDEETIGDTAIVRLTYDDDVCVTLSNGYAYHPSELQIVQTRKSRYNLTQAELQFLTDLLSVGLREYSEMIQDLKEDASSFWEHCDASDPETSMYFNQMNALKTDLKKSKELYKKLSEIQCKLKKQQGN